RRRALFDPLEAAVKRDHLEARSELAHLRGERASGQIHLAALSRSDAVIDQNEQARLANPPPRGRCEQRELHSLPCPGDCSRPWRGGDAHAGTGTRSVGSVRSDWEARLRVRGTAHSSMNRNGSTCVRCRASSPKFEREDRITESESQERNANTTSPLRRQLR